MKSRIGSLAIILVSLAVSFAQQIPIPRVEMMPNQPNPYFLRDWRQVALAYDSLVFDATATGQYLPVFRWNTATINYPNHISFGLHSYVGTFFPDNAEAINVLPAVIGATLAGIDKSSQNGHNYVLYCEEFFNRRPEENVYLNIPVAHSGADWWYDTMPNVFFYQLYDLYPGTGDFAHQFTTVADRWLEAVAAMGGSTTPWHVPYINYRGWYLQSMTPNATGVPEPEAAGALAWLLYMAYLETGQDKYRIGAEWAMEFLDGWNTNPAYELQLPYGACIAARMNAELGTSYDVQKLVNWCFEVGQLRQWGVIVGNWGGYDVHGLVGEALGSGNYAFAMNGFEQVGALVPLVRYDDRFARAIGKWVLNLANASRLFYSPFLPADHQDNEAWAQQYDPRGSIAYEGLRRNWNGRSPYATGDAMINGWAATNLGLYGSSHVGILAGIIDTTDVPRILRLNTLRTDYFHAPAYPTYLYFNPYPVDTTVALEVGGGVHDVYDAVSNQFLLTGVSGTVRLPLPGDRAVLAVIVPSGGVISYDLDRMLIDGVVVDYRSGQAVSNYPPRIKALAAWPEVLFIGETAAVYCTAEDRDGDALSYSWAASGGNLTGSGATVAWTAPQTAGSYAITAVVTDGRGGLDSARIRVVVIDNHAPAIQALVADPDIVMPGDSAHLTCAATDPDGDSLSYFWSAPAGTVVGDGPAVSWIAPGQAGYYRITCRVEDGRGGVVADSVGVSVGDLVGYYPFTGNAGDSSGFGNHGAVFGATLVPDRFGRPDRAYYFDGVDDAIQVLNHPSLNFREAITVNFWMVVEEFFPREAYPISHGNWENRWKVSIIPTRRLRWTVKTDTAANNGIRDVDSQTLLQRDSLYMVTVVYDGQALRIYLNGAPDAVAPWSGRLLTTGIDLSIGQHLPGVNGYNFKGVLDDIRIYNRALSQTEIQALYTGTTGIAGDRFSGLPRKPVLYPNYPNPFNAVTNVEFGIGSSELGMRNSRPGRGRSEWVTLKIYDILGREVKTLVNQRLTAGRYTVQWDGTNDAGRPIASGIYLYRLRAGDRVLTRKMVLMR